MPLRSEFAQLPDRNDSHWIEIYGYVYQQLQVMGLEVPSVPPTQIPRAALLAHLRKVGGKLVKLELAKGRDPDYQGKTDDEQTSLVNNWRKDSISAPPASLCLVGLPFAPNTLSLDDVIGAKQNGMSINGK